MGIASAAEPMRTDRVSRDSPGALRSPDAHPPASPIEAAYSARAGLFLRQFGYDHFGPDTATRGSAGAVQADYLLGPGDELLVSLRGQKSFSKRYVIDNAGLLSVDDIRPVAAQALTLAELRAELGAAVASTHPNTEVYVSVTEVRRIGVLVTGAVARPGLHDVGAFATLLDALSAAGGVTRAGSLRRIRLFQAGPGESTPGGRAIDLYDLLITGDGAQAGLRLRDGDRLFVPPLGPTLAVMGPVNRPGIYELPPERSSLSLAEAKELAGGVLRPGAQRALRFGIGANGEETTQDLGDGPDPMLSDGDLLSLAPMREDRKGEVRLEGHVLRPGPRALAKARGIDALLSKADLRPDPYLPFAVLASADPSTRARTLLPVDLAAVLRGRDRRPLAEGDTLYVLGVEDVDFLTSEPVLDLLRGTRAPPADSCQGLVVLARALAAQPDGPLAKGPQARAAAELVGSRIPCPPLFDRVPDLLVFALEHSTLLLGGVPRPGFYPSLAGTGKATLARVAGGLDEPFHGGASGGYGATPGGSILEPDEPLFELVGHVRRPGVRPLAGGTTLRDALAGGALRRDAYPLLGVIERSDRRTLARALIPFSPQEIAGGRANRTLVDGDRVHLFSTAQVHALVSATPTEVAAPAEPLPPAMVALLNERIVQVRGAVREPGPYPVAEAATLEALIAVAGGLSTSADPGAVEVTTAGGQRRRVDLTAPGSGRQSAGPGDSLRVSPAAQAMEARAVTIAGAVRRPGSYDVARGERLSSLIDRAGGLTAEAYPYGTVFLRDSERRREREFYAQKARELEEWMVREVEKGEAARSDVIGLARQLAIQLRGVDPPGRIVVEADPLVLRSKPDLDPLLEPDDRVVVPKRTLTVTVSGEVQHPVAAQFVSGKSPDDYLREAGGTTRNADPDRIFLVLPDGRAQPLALSSWNHTVQAVPPGSILVVPRDPKPFDFMEFSKNLGGILGQLAITAASVSVIAR